MPAIFAAQTAVTNDTGAVTLGFESAPNVLYDRTMVGATTYTIDTTGTTGGETMSITLRGAYAYNFVSSAVINWAGGVAPTPECSGSAFDRIRFEVLQDGTLLGTEQALGASVPYVSPTHYLIGTSTSNIYCPPNDAQNITGGFLDAIYYANFSNTSGFADLGGKWSGTETPTPNTAEFLAQLNTSGCPVIIWYEAGGSSYLSATCSEALSSFVASNKDVWVQFQLNISSESILPVQGNIEPLAAGSARFSYSTNGTNWAQLGILLNGLTEGSFSGAGASAANVLFGASSPYATPGPAKLYSVRVLDASGAVRYNPNLTALSSGQTGTFNDTAATPNVWTINGTIN